MGIEFHAGSEDDVVADIEESAVEYGGAGSPVGEAADAGTPEAKPERVAAGDEADDFLGGGKAEEEHLALEAGPPFEEISGAEGNFGRGFPQGLAEEAGGNKGQNVEKGEGGGDFPWPCEGQEKARDRASCV